MTSILQAAFTGDLELLRELASNPQTAAEQENGRTAVHFSVLGNQLEALKILSEEYNFDLFPSDDDNWNTVHVAASCGHESIIKYLLNHTNSLHPASATTKRARQTPLHLAAAKGHSPACALLLSALPPTATSIRNAAGQTPIHRAACAGHPETLKLLLEASSVGINYQDSVEDQTALHMAAQDGHFECVKLLLHFKADPSILDSQSKRPIDLSRTPEIRSLFQSI